jgi:gamma-glutamylcyclotransferase
MTSANGRIYFTYGSNIDEEQMARRCSGAILLGKARLPGHRFLINLRGMATVVPDESHDVHGVLWNITWSNEGTLDRYEGVAWGTYLKRTMTVETETGTLQEALLYIARDCTPGKPRDGYLEGIMVAAKKKGLPGAYIDELASWSEFERDWADSNRCPVPETLKSK